MWYEMFFNKTDTFELNQCQHLTLVIVYLLAFLELRNILKDKLANQIPVISVVAILGTTEQSAVDPLADILEIRADMRSRVSRQNSRIRYCSRVDISNYFSQCNNCWKR